jgi:hypothetical protein
MNLKKTLVGIIQVQWDTEDPEDVKRAEETKTSLTAKGWEVTSASPLGKCVLTKEVEVRG